MGYMRIYWEQKPSFERLLGLQTILGVVFRVIYHHCDVSRPDSSVRLVLPPKAGSHSVPAATEVLFTRVILCCLAALENRHRAHPWTEV